MSRNGQAPLVPVAGMTRAVVGHAEAFADRHRIPAHRHPVGQLIFASSGVMTVTTGAGAWVVPPLRAVWVPPYVAHAIRMTGRVEMRTIYVGRAAAARLPRACTVVHVSPLLRELVLRAMTYRHPHPRAGAEARLATVLLDEIEGAPVAPLHLPLPSDARLRRVTDALAVDPADARPLGGWSRIAGASPRTLARLFQAETGMGFRAWRQQLRLLRALERLAAGEAVGTLALDLGYEGPSAFIAMFRRALGSTPARYFGRRAE